MIAHNCSNPVSSSLNFQSLPGYFYHDDVEMSPLAAATFELQIVDVQTICEEFKLSSASLFYKLYNKLSLA